MVFPRFPGEWLWVLLGASVVFSMVGNTVNAFIHSAGHSGMIEPSAAYRWVVIAEISRLLLIGSLYLLILARVEVRRWQAFFVAAIVMELVEIWGVRLGMSGSLGYLCRAAVALALVAVIVADVRRGNRYPWTHWCGALILLWFCGSVG